jgi:MoaA/NifB/PqqE/SkfB family radical SAM enzyme
MQKIMRGEDIASLIGKRRLYIWGSGHFGASIRCAMSRIGVELTGFMDSNMYGRQFLGFPVEKPDIILAEGNDNVFIIISAFLFTDEIAKRCEAFGFSRSRDYLTHADIKPYHFEIDVAGRCNLRCITCPRGNTSFSRPEDGMMSVAVYKKLLDKLVCEDPLLSDVQLYSWGEPLLNPELPEMVAYSVSKGMAVALSSNLSLRCDLESVIKAQPTWFRVSLSGSDEEEYSTIHRGGKWDIIIDNMRRLSHLRAELAPKMFVDVNYHLYKHNLNGVAKVGELCRMFGFVFRTNYAFLDPLDIIIDYAKGSPLPTLAAEGRKYLLLDIDEAIQLSKSSTHYDCVSQNSFVIHSDLSFRRCTHLYNIKSNILAENFLEVPLEEILRRGENCEICRTCRNLGVHRFHFAYIDKGTELGAQKT